LRILLTNDDGINSEGLKFLAEKLMREHDVWIVAPDSEKSGSSHSITLFEPVKVEKVTEQTFVCWGTPADCVLIGLIGLVEREIDVVISGFNMTPNLGTDIIYSGTAAAARQGALLGKPSFAVSLNPSGGPSIFEYSADFIVRNMELFLKLWSEDHFLNINFPDNLRDGFDNVEVSITFPTLRIYDNEIIKYYAPNGNLYCFLGGDKPASKNEVGSDSYAFSRGNISISPIFIHPTNHRVEEVYRKAKFWCGER